MKFFPSSKMRTVTRSSPPTSFRRWLRWVCSARPSTSTVSPVSATLPTASSCRSSSAATPDGVRGFIVEKDTPGFTTAYHMGKFSLRASVTSQLFFEDCRVPEENMLPNVKGLKGPLGCLTQARYGIAWGALGAAMAVYNTAVQYAKSRIQFGGQPIASHQLVQNKLAWMITEITKGQLLALQAGRLKDQGRLRPHHVSMAKMNNVNIALESARMARDILGANGISDEYPIIRHMLNLESVKTYEGTHDIHNLIIGEAVTGIPAYNPPMSAQAEREATEKRAAEAAKK